jgi:hypothetical protein
MCYSTVLESLRVSGVIERSFLFFKQPVCLCVLICHFFSFFEFVIINESFCTYITLNLHSNGITTVTTKIIAQRFSYTAPQKIKNRTKIALHRYIHIHFHVLLLLLLLLLLHYRYHHPRNLLFPVPVP